MTLNNEVALVTGASRGIGKAIALTLGRLGAWVIGTATTSHGADAISDYMQQHEINGGGVALDVTDADQITAVIGDISTQYGAPTILVNNAGITRDNILLRMKEEEWDDVINTNLTAVFRLSKVCLRAMLKARHGRIVNIASVVGLTGNPGQANYAAAKAGMIGFTKSLAREIASRGITVNCVAPGYIQTDMTAALDDVQRAAITAQIPAGRLGTPEDIAAAVAYLASPEAGYITGETMHINGGMFMA